MTMRNCEAPFDSQPRRSRSWFRQPWGLPGARHVPPDLSPPQREPNRQQVLPQVHSLLRNLHHRSLPSKPLTPISAKVICKASSLTPGASRTGTFGIHLPLVARDTFGSTVLAEAFHG